MKTRLVRIAWLISLGIVGAVALSAQQGVAGPVTSQEILARPARRRLPLADVRRQLHQPAPQPADADHARQRQPPSYRSGRSRPPRSAIFRRPRSFATTSSMSPGRRTSPGRSTRAPGRRSGATAASCPKDSPRAAGLVNRGFGVLGDKLFMTTLDAHLLALDMKTGAIVWDVTMEEYKNGYAATIAPLVVKDKVIVGVAGGEYGCRCFIDAYDAQTGKRAWRFYTVPGPGEPGNETWAGDSWKRSGASIWVTGAYDPELNLAYFGTGNPGPDYHSASREGDNLYSDTLVALDVDTGKLRWHYQFTPHDVHDWDSTQVPILADLTIGNQPRKVVMFANRNGFYYTLDRTTGKHLVAKPFVKTTWATEIGSDGRPMMQPGHTPDEKGEVTCPDIAGGTNFWPPSFDPRQRLFFVNAREVVHDLLRVEAGVHPGRSVHRRRRPARERAGHAGLRRAARDRSDHGRAQVGVQVPQPLADRCFSRPRRT